MLLEIIKFLIFSLTCCSILYYLFCIFAAKRFFSGHPAPPTSRHKPATVMIPLCGVDLEALKNYASFCRQDYPAYQIVFGVQDPRDTSIPVVKRLMETFPDSDIELVVSGSVTGENPKVNNLQNMLGRAKYDVIVIVDSDIRVGEDYLKTIVPPLDKERVGLVTCFYRAGGAPNLAAKLEAIGITGEFAPGVLVAQLTEGISFALGATMALRRETLLSIGGFKAIADYLADDFMLGNLVWKAGHEVRLLPYVVETMPADGGLMKMIRHQIRWSRGIKACRPMGHLGSIVTHGTALALLNACIHQGSPWSISLLILTLASRMVMGWFVGVRCLGDRILGRNIPLLLVRDLLSFFIWCAGLAGKRVEWRGKMYQIVSDGKIVPVK